MEHKKVKCIKYLGKVTPVNNLIDDASMDDEQLHQAVVKFYERASKSIAKDRTNHYKSIVKVQPKSIQIEKKNNRWGSCNTKKEITYHYLISTLPIELIDYIVVHELCHLHHMNHDRSFWRKVGSILLDYKKRKKELEEFQ